ncbi:MAG: hypothetical protein ABSB24_16225 [Gaiellaceae bacterium]
MTRVREESGFGLLELLIAMVVLNIGLFALIGAFNAGTVAVSRGRAVTSATIVADKQMEIYRGLQNCAIWLDQWLMPASNSAYAADAYDYNGTTAFLPYQIPYFNSATSAANQYWVTDATDGQAAQFNQQDNLGSCAYVSQSTAQTLPLLQTQGDTADVDTKLPLATPPFPEAPVPPSPPYPSPIRPEQFILGPDNAKYTVDTYIVLVQPCIGTPPPAGQPCPSAQQGEWAKQVTVVVYAAQDLTRRVLAREVSIFDPGVAVGDAPG